MAVDDSLDKKIADLQNRLAELDRERASVLATLEQLKQRRTVEAQPTPTSQMAGVVASPTALSNAEKVALFRSLFRGRDDVFPRRWENPKAGKAGYAPACDNEWIRGICEKPRIKCSSCPNQAFVPVAEDVVRSHLQGRDVANPGKAEPFVAGVYPLMTDETCWFLAADFDKQAWQRDALAFLLTCREKGVPAALERSRSGNGGHVWIFFSEPIPASEARKLGAHLVTETMERCPDLGFESYDRFFPSQDTMPSGGFGNLIALPLQNGPRQVGNSVFVDDELRPYDDQWAFLLSLRRMSRAEVSNLVDQASATGRIVGVRLPLDDDDEEPWMAPPSRRRAEQPIVGVMPETVEVVLGNQVYIDRSALLPSLVNRLIRLAAFQNPEFYAAQAMRLPTFGKPRVISCAELFAKHIALPRGCVDAALDLLTANGIRPELRDERYCGMPLGTRFLGTLTPQQQAAKDALMAHDTGVLAATTAFGKTVVASKLIAERNTNTLVLVHRQQLLDQWVARLRAFLDIDADRVGEAAARPFSHRVVIKKTAFCAERQKPDAPVAIQELYGLLALDAARNDMIFDDILSVLEAGRSPVVITERKDHLQAIAERLTKFAKNVIVLKGGMGAKQRHHATAALATVPDGEERVIVATGRYLGEGFDDARLDTLFLTMPISWRGTLAQYAGRLHRLHAAKREVVIYDYVDAEEPVLAKMASRREAGYRALGYDVIQAGDLFSRGVELPIRKTA